MVQSSVVIEFELSHDTVIQYCIKIVLGMLSVLHYRTESQAG